VYESYRLSLLRDGFGIAQIAQCQPFDTGTSRSLRLESFHISDRKKPVDGCEL
jgi:hypothetical protein